MQSDAPKKGFMERMREMVTRVARHIGRTLSSEGGDWEKDNFKAREMAPSPKAPQGGVAIDQKISLPEKIGPEAKGADRQSPIPRSLLDVGMAIRMRHKIWCMDKFLKEKGISWKETGIIRPDGKGMVNLMDVEYEMAFDYFQRSKTNQRLYGEYRQFYQKELEKLDAKFTQSIRVMYRNGNDVDMAMFEAFQSPFLSQDEAALISKNARRAEGDPGMKGMSDRMSSYPFSAIVRDDGEPDFTGLCQREPGKCVFVGKAQRVEAENAESGLVQAAQDSYPKVDMKAMNMADSEFKAFNEDEKPKGEPRDDVYLFSKDVPWYREAKDFMWDMNSALYDKIKSLEFDDMGELNNVSQRRKADDGSEVFVDEYAHRQGAAITPETLGGLGCDPAYAKALLDEHGRKSVEILQRWGMPVGADGRIDEKAAAKLNDEADAYFASYRDEYRRDPKQFETPEGRARDQRMQKISEGYKQYLAYKGNPQHFISYPWQKTRIGFAFDNTKGSKAAFTFFTEVKYQVPNKLKDSFPDANFGARRMATYKGEVPASFAEFRELYIENLQKAFPGFNAREEFKDVIGQHMERKQEKRQRMRM